MLTKQEVLANAFRAAADRLGMSEAFSEDDELAVLFVRMYRSLDAVVGGDDQAASAWLKNHNLALQARPCDLIRSAAGLVDVIAYLDARRAVV